MNTGIFYRVTVAICGMALAVGCARKDVVKTDAALPPTATPVESVHPVQAQPPASPKIAEEQPLREPGSPSKAGQEAGSDQDSKQRLETVYFGFDSYLLSAEARDSLQRTAQWLSKKGSLRLRIEGHTDERGSDGYNLALGERRAGSVMRYLASLGVQEDRLSVLSYGEERPAQQGHGEGAWAKNRRAEFRIVE